MFLHPDANVTPNANPERIIDSFRGEYRFLSNFWAGAPIVVSEACSLNGTMILHAGTYATSEHLYQAAKTLDEKEAQDVIASSSPGESKYAGQRVTLRDDWESVKYNVMQATVSAKFAQHRDEAGMLLKTNNAMLIEGNTWKDTTWGMAFGKTVTRQPHGQNWLGVILMAQRSYLQTLGDAQTELIF